MQLRDWISGVVGLVIFLLGFLPLMGLLKTNFLPATIFTWIVAIAGLYLLVDALIEITNSNVVGWVTFWIAVAAVLIGLLPILHGFGIGPSFFGFKWISLTIYNIIFMIEGVFLMIATFAMEL